LDLLFPTSGAERGKGEQMKRKKLPWAWVRYGENSIMWCAEIRPEFRPDWNIISVVWGRRIKYGFTILPKDWWVHVWLPKWCKGRGYYISIGLWLLSIHRGY